MISNRNLPIRILPAALFLLAGASLLPAQALFVKPVKVLGDPAFVGTASSPTLIEGNGPNVVEGRELSTPLGIALDTSVSPPNVYIADSGNNRVLGFRYTTQLTAGAFADVILGQPDRFSNLPAGPGTIRSTGMNQPTGIAVDSAGNVYVADTGNNRILRFPKPLAQPAGSTPLPDMVLGQSTFSTSTANNGGIGAKTLSLSATSTVRTGLAFDSLGNLWVTDTANNRVLRYPVAALRTGTSGPAADLVLGASDFVTGSSATSTTTTTTASSKSALSLPQAISFDTAGRVLVADSLSRVVVYPATLSGPGTAAFRILGIDVTNTIGVPATKAQLSHPLGVTGTAAGIVVADTSNSRVMLYPPAEQWVAESVLVSPNAIQQIGQPDFVSYQPNQALAEPTASAFNAPADVAASGTELFVVDFQNSRVLAFPLTATAIGTAATRVIGQLDFPFNSANLIEGREFSFSGSSSVLDQSVSPPILYVADTLNNRVLGFKNFNSIGIGLQKADIVIGQPDFNRSLINYPSNLAATPNAQGLHNPTALAVDSAGNLYVADTGNSRILRFPAPFKSAATRLETADLVIGQASFTSLVTDPTAQTLNSPLGLALSADAADASKTSSGFLIVSDAATNRILFFPKPFSSGMSATKVLGATGLNSAGSASAAAASFSSPRGIAVDPSDRVLVADLGNRRIQIFNAAASINTNDTPPISLSTGFTQPVAIATSGSGFWVADRSASRLLHFPDVSQLALKNNASDASLSAYGPISAFVDSYLNLLVCDSANRVVYFAPQMGTTNAASFSTRAFTPGMLASLFPTLAANTIGAGTAAATSVPLPTTLSDTQVLINGKPAPLFYVSPGQINFQLSNSLSTGGTATIQSVRASTGQIFASTELPLASADPALFTSNGTGGGQVAASNFVDYSTNSSSNPVARGQTIILYGTGLGPVANPPADGSAATGAVPGLSTPQVLLGSSATSFVDPSYVTYSGLSPSLVGVWQINLTIPPDAPTGGSVPIRIFLNSIPSVDPTQSGSYSTTIAIK